MSEQNNSLEFIKEVAKYFMDFLETDFHKKKASKRTITHINSDGDLVGISLIKYEKFVSVVGKLINQGFENETRINVKRGDYTTKIPKGFLDLISMKSDNLSEELLDEFLEKLSHEIHGLTKTERLDMDVSIDYIIGKEKKIFKESFVSPFIQDIQDYIIKKRLGDESTIFTMTDELSSVLASSTENYINDMIRRVVVECNDIHSRNQLSKGIKTLTENVGLSENERNTEEVRLTFDIESELRKFIHLSEIKDTIVSFFESYKIGDLYNELSELYRNKGIIDKQGFYLYFYDITFNQTKYPIFYIPFNVEKSPDEIEILFGSQIYVHKRALEYIVQECNEQTNNSTHLKTIGERILYTADGAGVNTKKLQLILDEISELLKLNCTINISSNDVQIAKSEFCKISNSFYINIFDKSDEALINDYEEIIAKLNEGDNELGNRFKSLINDFVYKDPKKITFEIRDSRENKDLADKLIYLCPIPLNQEQQQIVLATQNDDCKYIIVQGPPGTGKSHTITAVVFDQILRGNSVLVLSDKEEAIDVVEDKITETMNKVRIKDDFQNPILRLGQTGNSFADILSSQHIEKIMNAYYAARGKQLELEKEINEKTNKLKQNIDDEKLGYGKICLSKISKVIQLEKDIEENHTFDFDTKELFGIDLIKLKSIRDLCKSISSIMGGKNPNTEILSLVHVTLDEVNSLYDILHKLSGVENLYNIVENLKLKYDLSSLDNVSSLNEAKFKILKELSLRYENEKTPIFGFSFKKKKLQEILSDLEDSVGFLTTGNCDKDIQLLRNIIRIINSAILGNSGSVEYDYIELIFNILKNPELQLKIGNLTQLEQEIQNIESNFQDDVNLLKLFNIDINNVETLLHNSLVEISDEHFGILVDYVSLKNEIISYFQAIPEFDFNQDKSEIEKLSTVEMTRIMDGKLTKFYEEKKNTAISIKNLIKKKVKFPKKEFEALKNAFPCILSGIRDYAEYIPLQPDIFDIVIIDEASQVSIAQAFPAILRAKKILVLGDQKQFSNVKTSLASIKENREYLNTIRDSFLKNISKNELLVEKSEMFNIKNSILDFCERICNYEVMLKKYFRGYKEIISYSNKYFYGNGLQVMKIRGKDIEDVIRFEFINHDGRKESKPNTNSCEIEFIIKELKKLKESGIKKTVGIITPHTNQQKALSDAINKTPESDYYYEKLKLKIMTFDSCQGEERDIIYYSMVATRTDDKLRGVFIKDLNNVNLEEDEIIKVQRLNVGFSRPKESIVFVLSKPIEEFSGEIYKTLSHYREERQKNLNPNNRILQNNGILHLIQQTDFYQENKSSLKIVSDFNLGEYLLQLDEYYKYPKYRFNCMIVYTNEQGKETKIIFEYDDFYGNLEQGDTDVYLSESDIYKEKVLESYGYKYLHINDFLLGDNPISILNYKFKALTGETIRNENDIENSQFNNDFIQNIQKIAEGLEKGTLKICEKCGEVKELDEFKDKTLKSGYGRQCLSCKLTKRGYLKKEPAKTSSGNSCKCPICGGKMVLRHSKYGEFYGCSKYPKCLGIIDIKSGKYIKF